jgi:hypothetical protein
MFANLSVTRSALKSLDRSFAQENAQLAIEQDSSEVFSASNSQSLGFGSYRTRAQFQSDERAA